MDSSDIGTIANDIRKVNIGRNSDTLGKRDLDKPSRRERWGRMLQTLMIGEESDTTEY
jgi:hypothetical protein